ncbi:UNVERIFIED_CONTAM: hypothetical protein FKN15_034923 [Acipenser sinensis]
MLTSLSLEGPHFRIPCRTRTCFSRIRRLLKVRFPSVQYLKKIPLLYTAS